MIFKVRGCIFEIKMDQNRMENAIRPQRAYFHQLFCWKSNLGLSSRHLGGILGRLGKIFGPSWAPKTLPRCATWAPRRHQDATKTYPRAAQNASQDTLGSPRPPRTSKTSKITPKSRWGTPRGLVFGAYMGAFGTILARILEHFLRLILDRCWRQLLIFLNDKWQVKRGGGHAA